MKYISLICCIGLLLITTLPLYSQKNKDTLSLANYTLRAAKAADNIGKSLSLSAVQKDSANHIYQDFLLSIIELKKIDPGPYQRSLFMQQFLSTRDGRLRKILTLQQFNTLLENRKTDQQKIGLKMDSVYKASHGKS